MANTLNLVVKSVKQGDTIYSSSQLPQLLKYIPIYKVNTMGKQHVIDSSIEIGGENHGYAEHNTGANNGAKQTQIIQTFDDINLSQYGLNTFYGSLSPFFLVDLSTLKDARKPVVGDRITFSNGSYLQITGVTNHGVCGNSGFYPGTDVEKVPPYYSNFPVVNCIAWIGMFNNDDTYVGGMNAYLCGLTCVPNGAYSGTYYNGDYIYGTENIPPNPLSYPTVVENTDINQWSRGVFPFILTDKYSYINTINDLTTAISNSSGGDFIMYNTHQIMNMERLKIAQVIFSESIITSYFYNKALLYYDKNLNAYRAVSGEEWDANYGPLTHCMYANYYAYLQSDGAPTFNSFQAYPRNDINKVNWFSTIDDSNYGYLTNNQYTESQKTNLINFFTGMETVEDDELNTEQNLGDSSNGMGGGQGTFDNKNDERDFGALPTVSAINTGFISMYNLSRTEIKQLSDYLWSPDFIDNLPKLLEDPMDSIISLQITYSDLPNTIASNVKVGTLDTGVNGKKLQTNYVKMNMGKIKINEYYGSFLDYNPNTKVTIYLPFIGYQQLNVNDVMGATLELEYNINLLTGVCVAQLKCIRNAESLNGVLYTFNGNINEQLPVTGKNYADFYRSVAQMALQTTSTVAFML